MSDDIETIGHGPGIVERRPVTCRCGLPVELTGSPGCGCDIAQARDGHHRAFYCGDHRCPGLRRGPCERDPDNLYRWVPSRHGSR